jgi:hypothetical protein
MKALNITIDHLLAHFKNVPDGEYGELVHSSIRQCLEPASYEEFMRPEPDTEEGIVVLDEPNIYMLGRYYHMRSPGQVVLYKNNLKVFFDTLIDEVLIRTQYITRSDLFAAARLVALKTYQHELFHFDCNVLRIMFGSNQDRLLEEALAVAWSRLKISEERKVWNSVIGKMNGVVYGILMELAYNFRSPGYRDWVDYADEVRFKNGLAEYCKPKGYNFLTANGVNIQDILFSTLGNGKNGQGFIEMSC